MANKNLDTLEAYRLHALGLTYQQIGKLQRKSPSTVHAAVRAFIHSLPDADHVRRYQDARVQLLDVTEERLLASLTCPAIIDKAIERGNVNGLAFSLKAVHSIRRLEQGESTANVSSKLSLLIAKADQDLFGSSDSEAAPAAAAAELSEIAEELPQNSPPPAGPGVGGDSSS